MVEGRLGYNLEMTDMDCWCLTYGRRLGFIVEKD